MANPLPLLLAGGAALLLMSGKKSSSKSKGYKTAKNVFAIQTGSIEKGASAESRILEAARSYSALVRIDTNPDTFRKVLAEINKRASKSPNVYFVVYDFSELQKKYMQEDLVDRSIAVEVAKVKSGKYGVFNVVAKNLNFDTFMKNIDLMFTHFNEVVKHPGMDASDVEWINFDNTVDRVPDNKDPYIKDPQTPDEPYDPYIPEEWEDDYVTPDQPSGQAAGVYQRGANIYELVGGPLASMGSDLYNSRVIAIASSDNGLWPNEDVMYFSTMYPEINFLLVSVIDNPDVAAGSLAALFNGKRVGQTHNWISDGAQAIGSAINQF